jgi:hypothetical protein
MNASGSARLAELACDWVELASSAVGPSSTSMYEDGRRRYTWFVTNVAGAQLWNGDLNQQLVCLLRTSSPDSCGSVWAVEVNAGWHIERPPGLVA